VSGQSGPAVEALSRSSSGAGGVPEDNGLSTSGLDWACRLLWGGREGVLAVRPGAGGDSPPPGSVVETYLALPRASNPRLLVPLASRRAAAAALARNHDATARKSRLVKALLGAGLRLGLAQRLLPDRVEVRVTGGPTESAGGLLLTEHLRDIFGRRDLHVAVILGTPRPNRKPVLQVMTGRGEILGYVKAAWNDLTRGLVRHEAAMLVELASVPRVTFTAPHVIHHGPWGELELLAASPLPNAVRPEQSQVFDPPIPVIREVAGLRGISTASLAASPYWAGVRERLASRAAVLLPGAADPLQRVVDHVEARFGESELRFGTWHGDFTPWNMARLDNAVFIWDWERSAPAPVGLDLLHFLFQSTCRFEGRNPVQSVEICRERTPGLLSLLDVPSGSESALWSVYRMELLFRYDEARLAGVLERRSRIHSGILEMFEREMEAP
jgi:hypothetical protein